MSQHIKETGRFSWIPGFFRHDALRKAIALFFAVLFYFTVTSRLGDEQQISNIPVEIDLPSSLVSVGKSTPKVNLIIKGSKGALKRVSRGDFKVRARVKLTDYKPNEIYSLTLNSSNISSPFGIKVLRIEPRELPLYLDKKISKKVRVGAVLANEKSLPKGYAVEQVVFQPSEVIITGPESIVSQTYSIKSNPIPLSSSLIDSFDYETRIDKQSFNSVTPNKVTAQVKIIRQNKTVTFKNVAIKILENPNMTGRFKVELLSSPHVAVTVSGLKNTVNLLKNDSIKPYIDVSSLDSKGTFSVNVACWVNSKDNIQVKNIYPEKVQVKIIPAN